MQAINDPGWKSACVSVMGEEGGAMPAGLWEK